MGPSRPTVSENSSLGTGIPASVVVGLLPSFFMTAPPLCRLAIWSETQASGNSFASDQSLSKGVAVYSWRDFTLNLHLDWQASKIGLLSTAQLTRGKTARCLGDLAETRTPPRIITVPNGVIMVTLDDDGRRDPHGFQGFSRLWS